MNTIEDTWGVPLGETNIDITGLDKNILTQNQNEEETIWDHERI